MSKRFQQADEPPHSSGRHTSWSIHSNGLTSAGQSDLLKQIGRQLQSNYQYILREPAPDQIRDLLGRLEARQNRTDGEDSENS